MWIFVKFSLELFSDTKACSHSGLGAATCEEPGEADEVEGEGVAEHPVHRDPCAQTSVGLPGLGIDHPPPDTIDEGSLLYKLCKQENK